MNITFIGNCQTVSLCFYLQQLLNPSIYNICWVLYGEEFKQHLSGDWRTKCKNKISDSDDSIVRIKDSDIIIYQNIDVNKSLFSNIHTLQEITKIGCKIIQIPSIYFIHNDFDNSIKELIKRENINNVNIKVSNILIKFKDTNLILDLPNHPNTFLFMEIVKIICNLLDVDFFTDEQYNNFIKDENYMQLPGLRCNRKH
jgi:hypothetical protein